MTQPNKSSNVYYGGGKRTSSQGPERTNSVVPEKRSLSRPKKNSSCGCPSEERKTRQHSTRVSDFESRNRYIGELSENLRNGSSHSYAGETVYSEPTQSRSFKVASLIRGDQAGLRESRIPILVKRPPAAKVVGSGEYTRRKANNSRIPAPISSDVYSAVSSSSSTRRTSNRPPDLPPRNHTQILHRAACPQKKAASQIDCARSQKSSRFSQKSGEERLPRKKVLLKSDSCATVRSSNEESDFDCFSYAERFGVTHLIQLSSDRGEPSFLYKDKGHITNRTKIEFFKLDKKFSEKNSRAIKTSLIRKGYLPLTYEVLQQRTALKQFIKENIFHPPGDSQTPELASTSVRKRVDKEGNVIHETRRKKTVIFDEFVPDKNEKQNQKSPKPKKLSVLQLFDKQATEELKWWNKMQSEGFHKSRYARPVSVTTSEHRYEEVHPLMMHTRMGAEHIVKGLRSGVSNPLREAIDHLAKAERECSFKGAIRAAELAAAAVPPEHAEEAAAEGARGYTAEITDTIKQVLPGNRPIEIVGYLGVTKPTS